MSKSPNRKCSLCARNTAVFKLSEVEGNIEVQGKSFKTKKIVETIIIQLKLLNQPQLKMLHSTVSAAPRFCENCISHTSNPSFFTDCQNIDCENDGYLPIELEPDLNLFTKLPNVKCRVQTAVWCQQCRQDKPTTEEIRVFNKILDRMLKGNRVCLVPSSRTKRALNFKKHLAPRAVAVFPVVSSSKPKQILEQSSNEKGICNQFNSEVTYVRKKISKSVRNKYKAYDQIEVNLRKLIFGDKALESLLFSREEFLKRGVSFRAHEFSDQHIAGLLKVDMNRNQLRALQRSMSQVMGHKLTSNLKKTLEKARNSGIQDAGDAAILHCGEFQGAKFWRYENITEVVELLVIRAQKNRLLAKHTNQSLSWKIAFCSDRAHGITFVHLVLQNSIEPASAKTSLTIASIYDLKEDIKKNSLILKNIIDTLEKLHLKHSLKLRFPKLTKDITNELKKKYNSLENPFCIEKQIHAIEQLKQNKVPVQKANFTFQKPVLFEIPESKRWEPITVKELKLKIKKNIVVGPLGPYSKQQIEKLENEVQDLRNLDDAHRLTPCPLCCRTFMSPAAAIEHTITIHPRFNLNDVETNKFSTNLKSQVDVRETSLAKLLLNQLSIQDKLDMANEIVNRQSENQYTVQVPNIVDKSNYHVSQYCTICVDSEESVTPPILFEILFPGQEIELPFEFVNSGDASYLVDILGITKSFCFKCELTHRIPKFCRGKNRSRQHIDLKGENDLEQLSKPRTMERAFKFSKYFKTSTTRDITKRRKESHNYEAQPFPKFPRAFKTTEIPEFHTEINIVTKRVYLRGLEYVKLQDAHLLENGVVQPNQRKAYILYTKVKEKYVPEKNKFEKIKRKLEENLDSIEKTIVIVKDSINKLRKPGKSKKGKGLRKKLAKIRKSGTIAKRELKKHSSKFLSSQISRKFDKARKVLLACKGPREIKFEEIGIKWGKEKGGSLNGNESDKCMKSNIMDIVFQPQDYKVQTENGEEIHLTVGHKRIHTLATEYIRLRNQEFKLTCRQRSFCHHEINKIDILNGSASRLEIQLYADQVELKSTHLRDHLINSLKVKKELIGRDSTMEFLNQRAIQREQKTKYAINFEDRAHQMNQRQHLSNTAMDFEPLRKSNAKLHHSRMFPQREQILDCDLDTSYQ